MHASSQFEGFIKMERLSNMEIINNNVSRLCERYMRSYKIALISLTQDRLEDWFPQAVFISFCLPVVLKEFSVRCCYIRSLHFGPGNKLLQ